MNTKLRIDTLKVFKTTTPSIPAKSIIIGGWDTDKFNMASYAAFNVDDLSALENSILTKKFNARNINNADVLPYITRLIHGNFKGELFLLRISENYYNNMELIINTFTVVNTGDQFTIPAKSVIICCDDLGSGEISDPSSAVSGALLVESALLVGGIDQQLITGEFLLSIGSHNVVPNFSGVIFTLGIK